MRTSIAFIAVVCCAAKAAAQGTQRPPTRFPALPPAGAEAEAFVPRGWTIETRARGDLNGDGAADLAFVLLAPDRGGAPPRSSPHDPPGAYANPRMLGIALARPQGGYRLAALSRRFLPPKWAPNGLSQGWMLFEEGSLDASGGRLRVEFQYTRGHRTFTFRWQDGALRLIGHDVAGVEAGCLHHLSVNLLTGRARMLAGYVDSEEERVRWRNVGRRPLLTLAALGDGEEFDPYGLWTRFPLRCPERE